MTSHPLGLCESSYEPPAFVVAFVDLHITLDESHVRVRSTLDFRRKREGVADLALDGDGLTFLGAKLNGEVLDQRRLEPVEGGLVLRDAPDRGVLELTNSLSPGTSGMEGLIRLGDALVTHCEPQGFRRITYFPDRPDIMASYRCTLVADKNQYPVLLANGERVEAGELSDGRHYACWEDRQPKGSYLFAIAAGRFETLQGIFVTDSGRKVVLTVHAHADDIAYCSHGLETLQRAMAWDEKTYGREYARDTLNVVVMRDYPGGAMENPGLNLYAAEFFLADPSISTDTQLRQVTGSVGHEYFHEWTGNRVGCREWRELTLKEGYTVLREQQFLASQVAGDDVRIDFVSQLRQRQYPEDDGALSHAPRPRGIAAASNLYTRTVYDKGAEIMRMLCLIVGEEGFKAGTRLFLDRFDGRAACLEDMLNAMEEATGVDLEQFARWYDMAGACRVTMSCRYEPDRRRLQLMFSQTALDGSPIAPLHIPVKIGLLASNGGSLTYRIVGDNEPAKPERTIALTAQSQTFVLDDVASPPIPSVFRGLSAPVRLERQSVPRDLATLARFDTDPVNRWDAAQSLGLQAMAEMGAGAGNRARDAWHSMFDALLGDALGNPLTIGRLLALPLKPSHDPADGFSDMDGWYAAQDALVDDIVICFGQRLRSCRDQLGVQAEEPSDVGARRMRNLCHRYLMYRAEPDDVAACQRQLETSSLMENAAVALRCLVGQGGAVRDEALALTRANWKDTASRLDHWFSTQATSQSGDCAELVAALTRDPAYSLANATRVKALFDSFIANHRAFHRADGGGYRVVAATISALSNTNPRLASRFLQAFSGRASLDRNRRKCIDLELSGILQLPALAPELRDRLYAVVGSNH